MRAKGSLHEGGNPHRKKREGGGGFALILAGQSFSILARAYRGTPYFLSLRGKKGDILVVRDLVPLPWRSNVQRGEPSSSGIGGGKKCPRGTSLSTERQGVNLRKTPSSRKEKKKMDQLSVSAVRKEANRPKRKKFDKEGGCCLPGDTTPACPQTRFPEEVEETTKKEEKYI